MSTDKASLTRTLLTFAGALTLGSALSFGLAGCEDAADDTSDAVKDAADATEDAAGDAADAVGDAIDDAGDAIDDATDGQ
ncbi:MAG: hypothetical protein ACIAQF_01155 [Phycisphaerales bacterium JB065]